jgi:hypothetical protein
MCSFLQADQKSFLTLLCLGYRAELPHVSWPQFPFIYYGARERVATALTETSIS